MNSKCTDETIFGGKGKRLHEAFLSLPPDFDAIRKNLADWELPSEVLSRIVCEIVDEKCRWECMKMWDTDDGCLEYKLQDSCDAIANELVTFYLPEIITILLDYGMNPNDIDLGSGYPRNIMELLQHVQYKDYAARCVKLLLEHGGDPNLDVDEGPICAICEGDVIFNVIEGQHLLEFEIPYWFVLMGFGGLAVDNQIPVDMIGDYKLEIFKDYDKYDYRIEFREKGDEKADYWTLYIYEKDTGIDVATL